MLWNLLKLFSPCKVTNFLKMYKLPVLLLLIVLVVTVDWLKKMLLIIRFVVNVKIFVSECTECSRNSVVQFSFVNFVTRSSVFKWGYHQYWCTHIQQGLIEVLDNFYFPCVMLCAMIITQICRKSNSPNTGWSYPGM